MTLSSTIFLALNKKIGGCWSANTRDYEANVHPPLVGTAPFAEANALEFGPSNIAAGGVSTL